MYLGHSGREERQSASPTQGYRKFEAKSRKRGLEEAVEARELSVRV